MNIILQPSIDESDFCAADACEHTHAQAPRLSDFTLSPSCAPQVQAAISKPWKPILDSAVEKFKTAGAAEADVRTALKNHTMAHELDLGPDPEPEQAPEVRGRGCTGAGNEGRG